ncbi:hypothetical protein [Streptomyces sp. NPDC054958]
MKRPVPYEAALASGPGQFHLRLSGPTGPENERQRRGQGAPPVDLPLDGDEHWKPDSSQAM